MFRNLLRVVTLTALFLYSPVVLSKKPMENLETYKDQISKAQVLLIQRDRYQAAQILIGAINREGVKSASYLELTRALQKTVEVFFSEKAQQSYEMALSVYPTNKQQAADKLVETLGLEPNNGLVLKALQFTLLGQKECGASARYRSEYSRLNPYDKELEQLHFLELVCQKNKTEGRLLLAKLDPPSLSQPFWGLNRQRLLDQEAGSLTLEARQEQAASPEITYLRWLQEKDVKKRMALAEKYKNLCHTAIPFDKAYAWMDPWACEHLKEIEEFHARGERGN